MSRNDAVSEPNAKRGSEADDATETVDLGIGISVAIDVDAEEDADRIELDLDEEGALGSADASGQDEAGEELRRDPDEIDSATREVLEAADIDPDAVREKEYSYRMLLEAAIDESTAAALRRRFSLPWSFESDGDLERRSAEVRGLGDAEREWIAVSGDEDWQAFEYERSPITTVVREKPSERPWPKPTPVTAVTGVGPDDADKLAEAGIRSAERLATISAFEVARVLEINVLHVRTWRHNARELLE
ncbi:DUF7409 domain-containing protein [Natronorubrum halophilum]|uniref:DUF7409 domain-containing protein n=1 Tax=Natronorubrum halophilum TaxID=1702106 RepID=UPI000EF6FDA3|nr:hypothetical protein [Natronorubrum halophilum]